MATIAAICTSEKRGTVKHQVDTAHIVKDFGLENDAHAGKWHRQVSLLAKSRIDEFNAQGGEVSFGDFGENIVVDGFSPDEYPVGTRFVCGDVVLEMTQIGKQCHSECEIFKRVGMCIMPIHGVFARVIEGGYIHVGDEITIIDAQK